MEFFEIDFSNIQANFSAPNLEGGNINIGADPVYRFCSAINGTNPLYWQGKAYQPIPINAEGFEVKGEGGLPRPKLKVASPEGLLSKIVHSNSDFAGCKVTRKRTFARFIDDDNFLNRGINEDGKNPLGEADPNSHFQDDVFFINRKTVENSFFLEWELVSALEWEDAAIPARIMLSNYCPWKYRSEVGCRYKGFPIEDSNETSLTDIIDKSKYATPDEIPLWSPYGSDGTKAAPGGYDRGDAIRFVPMHQTDPTPFFFVCLKGHKLANDFHPLANTLHWGRDECSKSMNSCKLRFGRSNEFNGSIDLGLPFGGFPGVEKYDFQ